MRLVASNLEGWDLVKNKEIDEDLKKEYRSTMFYSDIINLQLIRTLKELIKKLNKYEKCKSQKN